MKNHTALALIIGALTSVVNTLEGHMHLLDSVTDFDSDKDANERLLSKHKMTVSRLDHLVCTMRAAQLSGETSVQLNHYQLHYVNRAILDQIAELNNSMTYFCQMGDSEMVVRSFQKKIEALNFAAFEANTWV